MSVRPVVSVVIPARNAASTLTTQLAALSSQTFAEPYEVIVADNGSSDSTALLTGRWSNQFSTFRTVDASKRLGISYARNTGIRAAAGDYILFCDADDKAAPGWIQGMVEALRQCDLVGGRLDLKALNQARVRAWRIEPDLDELPVTMGFLPYATGANMGVKASVCRNLGGFNESYLGSCDDVEFCWHAQLNSYRLTYAPRAVMHYRLRSDLRRLARQRYGYGRSYAQLFAQYAHLGIPAGSLQREIQIWTRLLLFTPQLATPTQRGRWVYAASWNCGRIVGSAAHRSLCPSP